MTEATGQKSSDKPVEDLTPPWEMKWNDVQVVPVEKPQPVVEAPQEPWDQMWGVTTPKPIKEPVASPRATADRFTSVFNRLVGQESGGKHRDSSGKLITSPDGALGITQVMPNTGDDPGFGVRPVQDTSEGEYLRFGKDYLQAMLKEFNGDYEKALGAYNAGIGTVQRAITKAEKAGGNWMEFLPARAKRETIPYIRNILKG